VVGHKVNQDLDSIRVRSGHQVIEGRPAILVVAEVLVDLHHVARPVAVVAGFSVAGTGIHTDVSHRRRDPDAGHTH